MAFTELDHIDIHDGTTTRRIALYEGDLSAIPPAHYSDILLISAFPNDYTPVPGTVIGALDVVGLSVARLAANKAQDMRATSAFWISQPIGPAPSHLNIGQIACYEPGGTLSPPSKVGDLFRGLFPFLNHQKDQTVAMPVLASGNRRWPLETMLHQILDAAVHWMARGLPISELKIVQLPEASVRLAAAFAEFKSKLAGRSLRTEHPTTFDVFLSFSSQDATEAAEHAKAALTARNNSLTIFDFRVNIDTGTSWQREIAGVVDSSRYIIVILTPRYFSSRECLDELEMALLRSKEESARQLLFPFHWLDCGKLDIRLRTRQVANCLEGNVQLLASEINRLPL